MELRKHWDTSKNYMENPMEDNKTHKNNDGIYVTHETEFEWLMTKILP